MVACGFLSKNIGKVAGVLQMILWYSMNVVKWLDTQTLLVLIEFVLTVCIQGW